MKSVTRKHHLQLTSTPGRGIRWQIVDMRRKQRGETPGRNPRLNHQQRGHFFNPAATRLVAPNFGYIIREWISHSTWTHYLTASYLFVIFPILIHIKQIPSHFVMWLMDFNRRKSDTCYESDWLAVRRKTIISGINQLGFSNSQSA